MSSTTLVAWWGAILSTVVFAWDIYKYRQAGPKLRFSVRTGMGSINIPSLKGKTLIQTEVTNYGQRATTLTDVTLYYFEKPLSWARLRNRPTRTGVLLFLEWTSPLPCELKAGSLSRGHIEQVADLEKGATKGALYFDLHHSHSRKPVWQRVVIQRLTTT